MKQRDANDRDHRAAFAMPPLTEVLDRGVDTFKDALADIRHALLDEAWFGRSARASSDRSESHSYSYEPRSYGKAETTLDDALGERWSASDQARQQRDEEHAQELDFDR